MNSWCINWAFHVRPMRFGCTCMVCSLGSWFNQMLRLNKPHSRYSILAPNTHTHTLSTVEVSTQHGNAPIILAGDFNSVPDSSVYRFLTSEEAFTSAYAYVCAKRRPAHMANDIQLAHTAAAVQQEENKRPSVMASITTSQQDEGKKLAPKERTSMLSTSAPPFVSPSSSPSKLFSFTRALDPNSPVFSPGSFGGPVSSDISLTSKVDCAVFKPGQIAFESSTSDKRTETGEPAFTNYRDIFHGAIDYVFYRGSGIEARACLGMIGEAEARREGGGLPNSHHPSDHLPIAVNLLLKADG
jgi:endonuclease/exonuclease/phosphatase family metal-dependent hydrolase